MINVPVTGAATFRGNIRAIGNNKRHMGLMALSAVVLGHGIGVRPVALETGGNIAVPLWMTEGCTGKSAVAAGMLAQLISLVLMTGQTGGGQVFAQFYIKRRMGIHMAGKTAVKLKMRFTHMAPAALRDYVRLFRRMADMAVNTGNLGFMRHPPRRNVADRPLMAFYTIPNGQNRCSTTRLPVVRPDMSQRQHPQKKNQQACAVNNP